jgi:hypothetical protein
MLAPSWIFSGHDSFLAVDIGGTNIRAGVIELNLKKTEDLLLHGCAHSISGGMLTTSPAGTRRSGIQQSHRSHAR